MALFIGDYTKSLNTKVSVHLHTTKDPNEAMDLTVSISENDGNPDTTAEFTLAKIKSSIVAYDIKTCLTKSTGKCTKESWASLWYFEIGKQVVIAPALREIVNNVTRAQYTLPLDIQSISNDVLNTDAAPNFRYVKDAICIITDADDPVRYVIDTRNTVGTVVATLESDQTKPYKMYIVLVKYNNWSKLKHPAHIVIHDESGSRDVRSYILGSTTVKMGKHDYTMNALLEDDNPKEELRVLKLTIQREKNRAMERQKKYRDKISTNANNYNKEKTKYRNENNTKRPKRKR